MKKGFTLIELLAVLVVLSIITLISVPIMENIIDESKRESLENSINGIISSANYYALEHKGTYEFLFDENHNGETKSGEKLDYHGNIDATGKMYLDEDGNISICVYNDRYYAYKNSNSGIVIGNKKEDNCEIGYDTLTNRYIAYLESEGMSSSVYTKEEVNSLISNLTAEINNLKDEINSHQNEIKDIEYQTTKVSSTNYSLENSYCVVKNKMAYCYIYVNVTNPINGWVNIGDGFPKPKSDVYNGHNEFMISDEDGNPGMNHMFRILGNKFYIIGGVAGKTIIKTLIYPVE